MKDAGVSTPEAERLGLYAEANILHESLRGCVEAMTDAFRRIPEGHPARLVLGKALSSARAVLK